MFWFRLEAIKRSVDRQNITARLDEILTRAAELLKTNGNWAVIGGGLSNDVIMIDQEKMREFLGRFPLWCKNVVQMGLAGAVRSAFEAAFGDGEKCHHSYEMIIPFEEGLVEKTMICGSCKRSLERFIVYKCEE
ncbi:Unknown protein [Striga hermonthica]|uniref:Sieve element occlusion C-terminal domain-containing protein n=1 Tax=Striga hermonthica TaxID=68872 RepID=A0A9N7MJ11_STRHE|nr:Unknown protein [Striga hermonthica]